MRKEIQKKYFIGTPRPGKWASVYAYTPQNPEFLKKRGEIFAAISMTSPESFNVNTAGNLILDHLHESYFENETDRPMSAAEKAVLSTQKYLGKLLENDDAAEIGIDVDLIVLVVHKKVAYFVSMGQGHAHILRDGLLVDIAPSLKDPSGRGQIRVGSMMLKHADVVILSSPALVKEMTRDELLDIAVEFDDTDLKKRSFDNGPLVSAIMLGYGVDRRESRAERALLDNTPTVQETIEKIRTDVEEQDSHNLIEVPDDEIIDEEMLVDSEFEEDKSDANLEEDEYFDDEPSIYEQATFDDTEAIALIDRIKEAIEFVKLKLTTFFNEQKRRIKRGRRGSVSSQEVKDEMQGDSKKILKQLDNKVDKKKLDLDQPTYKVYLQKITILGNTILTFLKKNILEGVLGFKNNGMYLKGKGPGKNWRAIIIIAIVIIAFLFFGIKALSENNARIALEGEYQTYVSNARALVEEVEPVADIIASTANNASRRDQMLSKLSQAETELGKVGEYELFVSDISTIKEKIEDLRNTLNKIIAVKEPSQLVDVAGLFPGANPTDITIANGNVYISDSEYGKIYQISKTGGSLTELVSDLSKPKTITADDNGDIVFLDEDGDRRLGTVKVADGSVIRHAGTSEFRVGNVQDIEFTDIFDGRIYGVDQNIKAVIMLQRSGDSYGIPSLRFELDGLETGTDIKISDMKIYVLANINQGLYRSLNNADDTPQLLGLEASESLRNATAMDVDNVYVYIADSDKTRILIFDKGVQTMELKAQYVYQGPADGTFGNIKEIVADRSSGKLFVLDGTTVYTLPLSSIEEF